jgi:hypothetical protein
MIDSDLAMTLNGRMFPTSLNIKRVALSLTQVLTSPHNVSFTNRDYLLCQQLEVKVVRMKRKICTVTTK